MLEYLVFFAVFFIGFAVLVVYLGYVQEGRRSGRRLDALPGAYSPEAYFTDPEKIPGRCPECYEDNDPKFEYCQNCATELPDVEAPDESRSIRDLFGAG